jgi:hypothetical protein
METGSPSTWNRRLLSAFLVFHLLTMGASLFKKTTLGSWIRQGTGPYERALGIWQSWGMFSPDPPSGSSYLVATGKTSTGEFVDRPVLVGELEAERFDWFYSRSLKLERSTFNPNSNRALRQGYGQWICAQAAESGLDLVRVDLWKRRYIHLSVVDRSHGTVEPVIKRVDLQTIDCESSK